MKTRSLREIQQKGERAITKNDPVVLTTRNGPIGILIPASLETIADLQRDIQKVLALQSLRETWKLASQKGLDRLSDVEINNEIKAVRKNAKSKHRS